MMAGNPSNWWSMHSNLRSSSSASDHQHEDNLLISQTQHHHQPSNNSNTLLPLQFLHGAGTSSSSSSSLLPFIASNEPHAHDFPHSWSQLLLGGLSNEQEERFSQSEFEATRVVNNGGVQVDVKEEVSSQSNNNSNNNLQLYANQFHEEQELSVGVSNRAAAAVAAQAAAGWSHHQIMPASLSPKSCITSLSSSNNNNNNNNSNSSNMLDFSTNNNKRSLQQAESHQHADNHTTNSECNSTATTGGVPPKKPRVQSSSTPPLKVRKEKLGDRITALHQLVSPFGKTDTASVLLEAIGYIRFLQGQIEALSSPYLGNNNASTKNQHSVHGERNCLFPDHPGQLLNDSCLKRRGAANQDQDNKDASKDLKSRGLCLVPISCTQLVGSDNGADYWAQSLGGGF